MKLLEKYDIPAPEIFDIEKLLSREGFIEFGEIRTWNDEFNNPYTLFLNPHITEPGIKALKYNYYEFSHIINKLKTPQAILSIIVTTLVIINTSVNIKSCCSNSKLEKTVEAQKDMIDSLKIKTNTISTIVKNIIKNTTVDTLNHISENQ